MSADQIPEAVPCPTCMGTGFLAMATLAQRIRFLRERDCVSLRQVPGISSALLSQIETGRITNVGAEKLCAIADAFDVSIDWLLGRK